MKAIIMAGGEGSRLRPLTSTIPKPLVKLCGRPVIEYILDLLSDHGVSEAVFTLRYRGDMIEKFFPDGSYNGIKLSFSYEDEPLGTAGCVKKAAEKWNEDFLVISGDALCDFDLTAALEHHKEMKAAATIITSSVDDPREYGLVISEQGVVKGFSEKPSYLSCISDHANTGVYVLSPKILKLIPSGKMYDFARDVFPQMLRENMMISSIKDSGYWCDIGDFNTYKSSQFDILEKKINCKIPYTKSFIVNNSAKILGKCYIGNNISLGDNSVIENSIIGENVTIGKNVSIKNSIILDGCHIGNDTTCNDDILCPNVRLATKNIIEENVIIGENTVIGEKVVVSANVKIWENKNIGSNEKIISDVKEKNPTKYELNERGFIGNTNIDITPELTVKIGGALTSLTDNILVSCDDDSASLSFKNALLSGISSAGGNAFDCKFISQPILIYFSSIFHAEILVHISVGVKTNITILNKHGMPLTRLQDRKLESSLNRMEYRIADYNSFGKITVVDSVTELYLSTLMNYADFKSNYDIYISSNNENFTNMITPIFKSVSNHNGEKLIITLNHNMTRADFRITSKNISTKIGYDKLVLLASVEVLKSGNDISLPADFVSVAEDLAKQFGQKAHRYFACSNDDDTLARNLAEKEFFLFDGAYLSLAVLRWLAAENIDILEACKMLPKYSIENRIIPINIPPQKILSEICTGGTGDGEGIIISDSDGRVRLRSNKKGNALFLFAESKAAETALSLCDDVEKTVRAMLSNK